MLLDYIPGIRVLLPTPLGLRSVVIEHLMPLASAPLASAPLASAWSIDKARQPPDVARSAAGPVFNGAYVRPIWPVRPGDQQMMLHLDFEVTDLEAETQRDVSLGAELPDHRPQDDVRVLLGPAGHPFCSYSG